jgi:putative Mg2+ transporter-C (MgtC) family protein
LIVLVGEHGFSTSDVTHRFRRSEGMEYGMTVHSLDSTAVRRLSDALRVHPDVIEFRISPTGD